MSIDPKWNSRLTSLKYFYKFEPPCSYCATKSTQDVPPRARERLHHVSMYMSFVIMQVHHYMKAEKRSHFGTVAIYIHRVFHHDST